MGEFLAEVIGKEAEALEVAEIQDVDPPSPRAAFTIIANAKDENQNSNVWWRTLH